MTRRPPPPIRRHARLVLGLAAAVWLSAPGRVWGAEDALTLYSRGLVQFHQQQYTAALALFEQAVAADTQDMYARYYRGLTYAHLHHLPEAIVDLRAVVAARPDITQAPLELGVALVDANEYAAAVPYLEQAQHALPEQAARAALFLGVAHLRGGRHDAAHADFEQAAADPDLAPSARYYLGVLEYQAQRWDAAQAHFAFVAARTPDSEIGREAQRLLDRLHTRPAPRYTLYATAGLEYDSNVVLAPLDDAVKVSQGVTEQSDGRVVLGAGGVYVPWRNAWAQLSVGYDFFQSLQFDLTDFNLQDHRPSLQLAGTHGPFRFGIFGRYDFYLLGSDRFLQQGTAIPFVSYDEGDSARTELFFRGRRRDFLEAPYSGVLDAWNYGPGVRQTIQLGAAPRSVWIGYRFDREDTLYAGGAPFAYDGHEVSVGLSWALGERYSAEITYAFRYEDYAAASGGRIDRVHLPIGVFRYSIDDHWSLLLGYLGNFNDSNQDDFNYQRHIASFTIEVRS